jgi:hypothetical protein
MVLKFQFFLRWVPTPLIPLVKYFQNPLPGPFPRYGVGNTHEWAPGKMHEKLLEWVEKYGDMYKFYMGPKEVILLANPSTPEKDLFSRGRIHSPHPKEVP